MPTLLYWMLFTILAVLANERKPCYVGPGLEYRAPSFVVPCLDNDDEEAACCSLGDVCQSGNTCWNSETHTVYQYGCTDVTYNDKTCPNKCGWNAALSPWVALEYCSNSTHEDTWVCYSPESCGCHWTGALGLLLGQPRRCEDMGNDARVALYAPSPLAPYVSLPTTYGGSTGYISTITIDGTATWISTAVPGYTPTYITSFTDYGPQPSKSVRLFPGVQPSPSTLPDVTRVLPSAVASSPSTSHSADDGTSHQVSGRPKPLSFEIIIIAATVTCISVGLATLLIYLRRRRRARPLPCHSAGRDTAGTDEAPHVEPTEIGIFMPLTMLMALVSGLFIAIGHHLFYEGLDGQIVSSQGFKAYGIEFTSQQLNIAGGTALAFFVKVSLVLAVSTSYTQAVWNAARARTQDRGMSIKQLDAAFSVLSNIVALKEVRLWSRYPLLILLAIVAWLLPFTAIVAPATLTIQSRRISPTPTLPFEVPNLDFRNLVFSATMAGTETEIAKERYRTVYRYNGPSIAVQRIVAAAAIQGTILPIDAPKPNATWEVTFQGPSLRCAEVDTERSHAMKADIASMTFSMHDCYTPTVYQSWSSHDENLSMSDNAYESGGSPKLYFALLPSLLRPSTNAPWNPEACEHVKKLPNSANWSTPLVPEGKDNSTMLECELIESQYLVNFTYENGIQSIAINLTATDRAQNFIQYFNELVEVNDHWLRTLSYQSVLSAFETWVTGTIKSGISQTTPLLINSSIMLTTLLQAEEMEYLRPERTNLTMASVYRTDLQSLLQDDKSGRYEGLVPSATPSMPRSLSSLIEELFQNITVSLMSSAQLRPNHDSITPPGPIEVSSVTYLNVYVYSPLKLWLAYGLALFFAAGAVITGFVLMYKNQASYSSNFSTILRTTRNAQINANFSKHDYSGVDPLSSHLASSVVKFDNKEIGVEAAMELLALDEHVGEMVTEDELIVRNQSSVGSQASLLLTDSEVGMRATHESPTGPSNL